jgi:hypothetical protein
MRPCKAQWSISSPTFWIRHQRTYHYSLFTNIQWSNPESFLLLPFPLDVYIRHSPEALTHTVTEISTHSRPTRRWMRTPQVESPFVFHPWSSVPRCRLRPLDLWRTTSGLSSKHLSYLPLNEFPTLHAYLFFRLPAGSLPRLSSLPGKVLTPHLLLYGPVTSGTWRRN